MKQPFEAVVARHGAVVLRVCRAVLGAHDADDAWSETFLAAMRAYPDLPDDANLEAWLVTIAHRKAIDSTRASSRRPVPSDRLPEPAAAADGSNPDPHLDPARDLADAVARLPVKQRQAVAYHYLAGLPYAEIAVLLGGTAAAARRAAADGVATLRRTYPSSTASENSPDIRSTTGAC